MTLSMIKTNVSGKKHIMGMQSNSYCTGKVKPQGKMFKKNDPKKMTISRKRASSLAKEHQLKRHRSAGIPSESVFHGASKSTGLCLQPPKSSGVSYALNLPSSSPAPHLPTSTTSISNTSCYSDFLFLKLIIRIAAFCQQLRASVTLCLLMLHNNSDQAEKHHFPPNWVQWSLSWQDLKENRKKMDYIMIWMVQKLLFSNAAIECKDSALQTPLLRPISNEIHDTCL